MYEKYGTTKYWWLNIRHKGLQNASENYSTVSRTKNQMYNTIADHAKKLLHINSWMKKVENLEENVWTAVKIITITISS
jgi:hypothetical protein